MKKTSLLLLLLLFGSFILTVSLSYAGDEDYDVMSVLDRHYQAISGRDFKAAYALRSNDWRTYHSYNYFYSNWESNYTIELADRHVISNDGYEAVVKLRIYSEDYNSKGNLHKAYYRGKAYMVYENGKWKIDDIQVKEE
jgi:hypothetical protein